MRSLSISVVSRILKHSLLQLMFFDTDFLPMSATSPLKIVGAHKRMGFGLTRPQVVLITRTAGAEDDG